MSDVLKVVSIADTALDVTAMNARHESGKPLILQYMETRDPKLPVAKPGKRLTWFHIRRLRVSEFNHVIDGANIHDQRTRAFSVGVVKIENFTPVDGGHARDWTQDGESKSGVRVIKYMTDEQMDQISPAFVEEIGEVVRYRSFLAHEPEVYYPPQQSLVALWTARSARAAVEARAVAESQSRQAPIQSAPSMSDSGEPDTVASVTE